MGSWGVAVFSNDIASDVREDFRDLIADGLDAQQATQRMLAEFGVGGVDDNDFWLALAVTAHKLGRMTPEMHGRAVEIVDDPNELARWPESSKRKRAAILEKVRSQLDSAQPPARTVRKRTTVDTALVPGQHVRWQLGEGKPDGLFRVLRIHEDRGGRYPVLLALDWGGSERKARKANRLRAVSGGYDSMRNAEVALGFIACGRPTDPASMIILDTVTDARTPETPFHHQYVVPWSRLHEFFANSERGGLNVSDARPFQ
jgi:hypothetical protein